jgi:hypothetical protein
MRPHAPVEAHVRALHLAHRCAAFDARPQTIALITGLDLKEVARYFPPDRLRSGRFPSSPEWFHTRNLIQRAEASILLALYRRIRELSFPAADALLSAFERYRETLVAHATISFDRAFNLVCHLDGLWLARERSFDLHVCRTCSSQYLAARSSVPNSNDCVFCRLIERYAVDPRLQCRFPARPLPDVRGLRPALPTPPDSADREIPAKPTPFPNGPCARSIQRMTSTHLLRAYARAARLPARSRGPRVPGRAQPG